MAINQDPESVKVPIYDLLKSGNKNTCKDLIPSAKIFNIRNFIALTNSRDAHKMIKT